MANGSTGGPRRILAFGLALLAVAVALFLALRAGGDPGGDAPVVPRDGSPLAVGDEPAAAPPARVESDAGRAVAAEQLAPEEALTPEQPPEPAVVLQAGTVLLTGAAIRVDAQGVEHLADDGSLVAVWNGAAGPQRREVEVAHGSFALEAPADTVLRFPQLVLAGRTLALEQRELVPPASRFLELRGRELFEVVLHVRSLETGEELDGVELWRAEGPAREGTWTHPGARPSGEPLLAGARSPVRVPPDADWLGSALAYWVRAAGHAWGRVALDHGAPGERTVELAGAGALEVEVVGGAAWLKPLVRLWPPDAAAWDAYAYAEQRLPADGLARFDALAPGRYVVSVERGWAQDRALFGERTVEVEPGETTRARVTLELPEEPRPVVVAGTLRIGADWKLDDVRLVLSAEGPTSVWAPDPIALAWSDMAPIDAETAPGVESARAWSLTVPAAGGYALEVEPRLHRAFLEVPEGGLSGVDLAIPAAAAVEVEVVDAANGETVAVEALHWSPPSVEGIVATPLYSAAADPATGLVRFTTPAGRIDLRPRDPSLVVDPSYRTIRDEAPFEVRPGRNRIELHVRRQYGVRFTFRDGEAVVPWSWEWRLRAVRTDGEARDVARSIGILWFREPGAYELASDGIPGFASIDGTPFEVLARSELGEVEVRLARE